MDLGSSVAPVNNLWKMLYGSQTNTGVQFITFFLFVTL